MQSQLLPISELYLDVLVKDKRYDSFVDNSGLRIGEFKVAALICMYICMYVCHVF